MAYLRLATLDPGQLLNLVLRLLDRGRRMLAEMLFQGSDMRIQFAGRSVQIDFLQFVQTTFLIQKEVVPYGVFRDTCQACDLFMGQAVALQPKRFHATLHHRHGMMIPLVV